MKSIFIGALVVIIFFIGIFWGREFYRAFPLYVLDSFKKAKKSKSDESVPFDLYGVHIFCGRVGCGKTISMVRRAEQLKRQYPKLRILANFTTEVADGYINDWRDIIEVENIDENGVNQGVLFLFDEIHLTFNSQNWRDAPDNLLEYISLQRHLHKCIFGASQVWSRVNKIIKEQTDYVIECRSYFGARLIKNICYTNENYQINGTQKEAGQRKRPKVYKKCFTATDELRSLYDTDEIIKGLSVYSTSENEKLDKRLKELLRENDAR